MIQPTAILVVNDRPADLVALTEALEPLGQYRVTAVSAAEALPLANAVDLAVAVLDIRMPDVDGFSLAEKLRASPKNRMLPIVFVSAFDPSPDEFRRIYTLGFADFVLLPQTPVVLRSKVTVFAELQRQRRLAAAKSPEAFESSAGSITETQERLQLLTEATSDYALLFLDPQGTITEWTTSAQQLFGYTAAEAVGQSGAIIFTPEDRAQGRAEVELASATQNGQAIDERQHLRKDGSRFPASGRLIALRERETGLLHGFAKIVRDASYLRTLEENERKFREIFETANEGIWILDSDSRIQVVNQRMAEMLGYEIGEIIGRRKSDFVFPEDQAVIRQLFEERRTGKIASSIDVRFRRKDGRAIWTLLSARPTFREGKFTGALDMFTDVTERRLATERFKVFFESSAAGYALVEPTSGRFISVNQRFCEISGRSQRELQQMTFSDVTHPDDVDRDRHIFDALYAGRVPEVAMEKRYRRPDGTAVWVALTTTIVHDRAGRPELQLSVVQDITERKQTEAELEERRIQLRLAIEAADLGVFYHNGETGEETWNDQAKRLVGVAPDTPASLPALLDRVHADDRQRVETELRRLLAVTGTTEEFALDYRVIWPDGSMHYLAANGVSEPRPTGTGATKVHLVGTVRDITNVKQFELELRQKVDERTHELQQKTNQLEAFCYTVAHDLRAPLRSINGYADLVMEEYATLSREMAAAYLERIKQATRRLDELILDLLSYSRIVEIGVTLERVELPRVVAAALRELDDHIREQHAVVEVASDLPNVWAEPSILQQVLVNLISNAVKFTPHGVPARVEIYAATRGNRSIVYVRDHGIGVPPEYQERIFRVFERLQAARDYPGTGIGLAIVAKAMERLGGRCGVESVPNEGSTFWIELKHAEP